MRVDGLTGQEPQAANAKCTAILCEWAAVGLFAMFDPWQQIFCDIYNRTVREMRRDSL